MINSTIKKVGWPRIIIAIFVMVMFALTPVVGANLGSTFKDLLTRFGMNAIMVLALIPMIQSGCGLNFGLPVGIIGGILGSVISIELTAVAGLDAGKVGGFFIAVLIGIVIASIFGMLYGMLLNRVKGDEMIIATYVGFSMVAFMNIMWLVLPFKNPDALMAYQGSGLRVTVPLDKYFDKALTEEPVVMMAFFAFVAFLVWLYFKSKTGTAMTAVGSNPEYAKAGGINVNRMRMYSVMLSSALAAVGIIVYQQAFGFIQLYNAPLAFAFPSVAAILLGGASVNKANIVNVLIGTFLFQGILTVTPTVINNLLQLDLTEVLRVIISNGMIVYALTRGGE